MFAYGICAGPSDKFERLAEPSIKAVSSDGVIWTRRGFDSIHEAYNSLLDEAVGQVDLEGLVLMHDDVIIEDPTFEARLRGALSDPLVGIVGVIGGVDHPQMPWWEGTRRGYVRDRQQGVLDFGRGDFEVDTVDGLLMVLSPRAIESLRFDTENFKDSTATTRTSAPPHAQQACVFSSRTSPDFTPTTLMRGWATTTRSGSPRSPGISSGDPMPATGSACNGEGNESGHGPSGLRADFAPVSNQLQPATKRAAARRPRSRPPSCTARRSTTTTPPAKAQELAFGPVDHPDGADRDHEASAHERVAQRDDAVDLVARGRDPHEPDRVS